MQLLKKRILAKIYNLIIGVKTFFIKSKVGTKTLLIDEILSEYSNKKRIVVLCSGPSANKAKFSENCLYLVTNSGYSLVNDFDFLYYVNDGFFVKKVLATQASFLKRNQKIFFYYQKSKEHDKGFQFLFKNYKLLGNKKIFLINELDSNVNATTNIEDFHQFYYDRGLPIKVQNSGMFLLLFGYMLSVKMNLPLDIYGLDLGVGGEMHFNKKGVVGKSVLNNRVKENVEMYLNYMYSEKKDIYNYSYFKGTIE